MQALIDSGLKDPDWTGEGEGDLSREEVAESVFSELLKSVNEKVAPRQLARG